jgi:protein-S-isoprenylcysteine O-methyltransferase Ste14
VIPGFEIEPASTWILNIQAGDVWLVLGAIGAYQLYLQLRTQNGERQPEGMPKVLQYVTGMPALVILAWFVFDPDIAEFVQMPAHRLFNIFGLVLFNVAGILILLSHLSLGRLWSGDLETKADHVLVDTGPYQWVRHPLYSSYFLLAFGLFALSGNWLIGFSLLVYFLTVAIRTPLEEAMLVNRLGERYVAYQRRTGRFLPRLTTNGPRDLRSGRLEPGERLRDIVPAHPL